MSRAKVCLSWGCDQLGYYVFDAIFTLDISINNDIIFI